MRTALYWVARARSACQVARQHRHAAHWTAPRLQDDGGNVSGLEGLLGRGQVVGRHGHHCAKHSLRHASRDGRLERRAGAHRGVIVPAVEMPLQLEDLGAAR